MEAHPSPLSTWSAHLFTIIVENKLFKFGFINFKVEFVGEFRDWVKGFHTRNQSRKFVDADFLTYPLRGDKSDTSFC